jgi:mannose-6-phosphate isomerase-like protein (cupin superfamily)|tara:strand:- start:293 stop:697 length:405 start_codon:yes stop_codon:yes gene_type:complete
MTKKKYCFYVKSDVVMKKVNLKEKLSKFSDYWSPKIIAEMNDYQIKLVKIKGDFVWHQHEQTDEVFIVIKGKMNIEFENETMELNEGEMYVVPKGVKHKPHAENECEIMLIEPHDVINTGNIIGELTASNDIWI